MFGIPSLNKRRNAALIGQCADPSFIKSAAVVDDVNLILSNEQLKLFNREGSPGVSLIIP